MVWLLGLAAAVEAPLRTRALAETGARAETARTARSEVTAQAEVVTAEAVARTEAAARVGDVATLTLMQKPVEFATPDGASVAGGWVSPSGRSSIAIAAVEHQGVQEPGREEPARALRAHAQQVLVLEKRTDGTTQETARVPVYTSTSDMCGAGLFSQPQLECSVAELLPVAQAALQASPRPSAPARAFGVELELVGRLPQREVSDAFLALYAMHGLESLAAERDLWDSSEFTTPRLLAWESPQYAEPEDLALKAAVEARPLALYAAAAQHEARERVAKLKPRTRKLYDACFSELVGFATCLAHARGEPQGPCAEHADCPPSAFCGDSGCEARADCSPERSIDGLCPRRLDDWRWERDGSVKPLFSGQSADEGEHRGVGFELVSPGPPQALSGASGLRALGEQLQLLKHVGVQAGPSSGLHVHVNVGIPGEEPTAGPGAGSSLSLGEIANVYAAYAEYQLVISEMLQDSRIGSSYARELLLGEALHVSPAGAWRLPHRDAAADPVDRPATFLQRMHVWAHGLGEEAQPAQFCNWVLDGQIRWPTGDAAYAALGPAERAGLVVSAHSSGASCDDDKPTSRYYQLNLATLNNLGTLEFRGFPATHDSERAVAWARFCVTFVEAMRSKNRLGGHLEDLVPRLREKQAQATLEGLEAELGMDLGLFRAKAWLEGPACASRPVATGPELHARRVSEGK